MGEQQKIIDNEILIGISITENNTIRVSVTNDEGDSETSDTFLLECARKNCTSMKFFIYFFFNKCFKVYFNFT